MIKKPGKIGIFVALIAVLAITAVSINTLRGSKDKLILDDTQTSKSNQNENNSSYAIKASVPEVNQEILKKISSSTKVEIYHNFHNYFEPNYRPAVLTDRAIIDLIINFFKNQIEPPTQSMSGMSAKDGQKLVFYDADNVQTIIPFAYDSLYNFGYIEYERSKIYLPYDFFRLISNLETVRPVEANIPEDVSVLLKKFNWTPAFLISSEKKRIPDNLLANSTDFQEKLYWAYNIELSKAEGMDFSGLLSKEITAEIYDLVEQLPEFSKPYLNARGIIIRHDGKIVGAYIDSGAGADKSCTLNRTSFNELKGMNVSEWLNLSHIDKNDSLYKKISKMSHEELIRTYFKAMADKDFKTLYATMSTNQCLQSLFVNMGNKKLYNTPHFGTNVPGYINKIEIKEIKEYRLPESDKGKLGYAVTADIVPTENAVISSGIQTRFVILENDNGVWKIVGDGTGP